MRTTAKVLHGHVLDTLRGLPDGSVHCCVTSPPYFNLRSYGGEPQVWGDGWTGHLGLEPEVAMYVAHLVEVFEEVRRVLRADGTLWCNLGDSYMNSGSGPQRENTDLPRAGAHAFAAKGRNGLAFKTRARKNAAGLKPKDMIGVPWRVAFALQDVGWWLRSDVIWHKSAAMPESVVDRPTKAHEYVFLLTKAERYYYDHVAIMEPHNLDYVQRRLSLRAGIKSVDPSLPAHRKSSMSLRYDGVPMGDPRGRNKRTVWTLNPEGYTAGQHFAVMPRKLAEPCILAGTSAKGVCAACGAPWHRTVERTAMVVRPGPAQEGIRAAAGHDGVARRARGSGTMLEPPTVQTTGWAPSCSCGATVFPATVLDPFCGAGTTGLVALDHGRSFIGCELNADFVRLSEERLASAQGPGFADFFDGA